MHPCAGVKPDAAPFFCLDLSFCHQLLTTGFKLNPTQHIKLVSKWAQGRPSSASQASDTAAGTEEMARQQEIMIKHVSSAVPRQTVHASPACYTMNGLQCLCTTVLCT
jgi:hypothetical protein